MKLGFSLHKLARTFLITLFILLVAKAATASCSSDQEHVFRYETPYPLMMAPLRLTTLGTSLAAWATENTSGQRNPAWAVAYGFAWAIGAYQGPTCADIPAHYLDGIGIAEEKSALPLTKDDHLKMIKRFSISYAASFLILAGVYIDHDNPTLRAAAIASAFSPLIGYGIHEMRKIGRRTERRHYQSYTSGSQTSESQASGPRVSFAVLPEPDEHQRYLLGITLTTP